MTFEVEMDGRTRVVSIERADRPGRFRVTLDGEPWVLDAARVGDYGLSIAGTVPWPADTGTLSFVREVHITPAGSAGELLVNLEGRAVGVTVNGRRTRHAADAGQHGHGELSIAAPMPGRVVRVLVAAGDDVTARQGVVVVEAMKMENELRAPRAGRVKEVSVTAGMPVEAGRVLAVIE
jgi:biotin carboxyl carrier protein